MKSIFMVAAICILAAACHRASLPAVTPVIYNEINNESGQTILVGHAPLTALQQNNYKTWYDQSYNTYSVDKASVEKTKPLLQNKRMDIFLGTWCGDSKREVPRMIKLLEAAGMEIAKLNLIFVDNSTERYKQSPQHEEKGLAIHHVPTFILYDEKKELGRIVESPVVSLEKDLLAILQQSYQPNYKAIDYWIKKVSTRKKNMGDAELQSLVTILKPLCRHYGEFNAFGYVQLAAGEKVEALNVFKLNTFLYPETAGVFDSLGEALAKTGDANGAITAYEKVLLLQPGDANARQKLAMLKR